MKLNSRLAKRLFLFLTPLVTSSFFSTSPGQAATFARADSSVNIFNFSQSPESTLASIRLNGRTKDFFVKSKVDAETIFFTEPAYAVTDSSIEAHGKERQHLGMVQTKSNVLGSFFIDADKDSPQSFSFNFQAVLNLKSSIQYRPYEYATAFANVLFVLVDSTDSKNQSILDFFLISGKVSNKAGNNLPSYKKSDNFTLDLFDSLGELDWELFSKYADVQSLGSYTRNFDRPTHLTLITTQKTGVKVEVPESSSLFTLLLFGSLACAYLGGTRKK